MDDRTSEIKRARAAVVRARERLDRLRSINKESGDPPDLAIYALIRNAEHRWISAMLRLERLESPARKTTEAVT